MEQGRLGPVEAPGWAVVGVKVDRAAGGWAAIAPVPDHRVTAFVPPAVNEWLTRWELHAIK